MKISIIGTVGVPACYGGFESLVENIIGEEHQFIVYCSSKAYNKKTDSYKSAELVYIPLNANGVQSILYDIFSLIHSIFLKPDSVLILGVSGCLFLPVFKMFSKAKIVTNIDGLEWKRNKWGRFAKRFLKLSEKFAVRYSDVVVSDNKGISDYVRNEYSLDSKVIAYGGDHAVPANITISDGGYALALCRIEPENNIEMILSALSKTKIKLKFIGNWDNSEYGRALKKEYSIFDNLDLLDPIYDINKLADLRANCSFYLHGHSAGGTNPSLVEMMHFGKLIYCFDCVYNRESTKNLAFFFSNSEELSKSLNSVRGLDANGAEMLKIAESEYTWDVVRNKYFEVLK